MGRKNWLAHGGFATTLAMVAIAGPAMAAPRSFNIPAQAATRGIPAFAQQAGVQILASGALVRAKRTKAVIGTFSVDEGLRRLLRGTGLVAVSSGDGVVTLHAEAAAAPKPIGWQPPLPQAQVPVAQVDAPAPAESDEPQAEIVITGSRIQRADLQSSSPILSVGPSLLQNRNLTNFADLASQLPQFGAAFGASRTQSTFANAANSGLNLVNLRNLGSGRTLTLINGRRVPGGTTTGTAVDFSAIPTSNIERIDILTGGAASIYGADAVAGVINIVTAKIDGLRAGASYGISERGDNPNPSAYLIFGKRFENGGSITLTGEYDFQGRVNCGSRYLCAQDFAWFPPAAPVRGPGAYSAVGENATFFLTAGNGLPAINATRIGDSTSYTNAAGGLIPFVTARDGFNRNALRDLAIPTRRLLFAGQAEYPVTERLKLFVEGNYASARINSNYEGFGYSSAGVTGFFGGGPGTVGLQPSVPLTISSTSGGVTTTVRNPIVPIAVYDAARARGMTTLSWQQRFNALNDRGAINTRETIRAVAGLRGSFEPGFGSDWNYEASYVYGSTRLSSQTEGLISTRQLYHGLRTQLVDGTLQCADAAARAAGCVPINPFLPYTAEQSAALTASAGQRGKTVLNDFNAFVSGSPFRLPGGNFAFSAGVEYRTLSGFLDYDPVINAAEVTGGAVGDINYVKITTREAYVEASAPILGDLPFVHSLTLDGSFRISDPNFGSTYQTWRYGGTFEPFRGIRFRANRARAVRTPVPGELSGIGPGSGNVNDPCIAGFRNANPTRAANCAADGVPATYNPPLNVLQSVQGFTGGNPNLNPERGTTLTYGVSLSPQFLRGFTLTVDRFDISMRDVVGTVGRQTKANLCYDTVNRQFCGDLTRGTNPNVAGATYVLTAINDQIINVASYRIKGIDINAQQTFPLIGGRASLQAIATLYDRAEVTPLRGQAPINLLGFAGGSATDQGFIKFTGNANATWVSGDGVSLNYSLRYVGKARNSPFATPTVTIPAFAYHSARVAIPFGEQRQFFFGVNNIADKQPPLFPSNTSGTLALDTIPAFYDVFGRSFFAGARVSF
ncbi:MULTISPECIES: TonB-dependent receptor [Alphaproteobacteria]|uniref:TonB-dependent receptor n=1 Tax=Alphaproteobacteria TaxID=28211 RepID=UPI000DB6AB3E|nr:MULTISPECIES: TonB-dependent receptor [Alphaproteobacteria]MBY0302714.1 TonB-dependent receptor [Sphingomonas ginsenosidimutans]PZP65976.1 MAG: hypothetical protein DI590_25560 [Methylorubrum populi]